MVSKPFAAVLSLSSLFGSAQALCNFQGTAEGSLRGTLVDTSSAVYSTFATCSSYCFADSVCESFAIEPGVECVLYSALVANNVAANSSSPFYFSDKYGGCSAPVSSTAVSSSISSKTSSTTSSPTSTSTCGVRGTAIGSLFGTYSDTATITYSTFDMCNIYCAVTTACQSFGVDPGVACFLYANTVASNVVANASSPVVFYSKASSSTDGTCLDAASQPTCTGFIGYDAGLGNIGYYVGAVYTAYGSCLALCNMAPSCLSFSLTSTPACILYSYAIEGNDIASLGSGNTFYDRGGICPSSTTTTTTTTVSIASTASTASIHSATTIITTTKPTNVVTSSTAVATPTCSGLVGYDTGSNIAYYSGAADATYSTCLALCNANADCLSFGITSTPACILYSYAVEGNDVASPGSGNTFYNRGGICASSTSE